MKRIGHLWERLVSDENLYRAIDEVNRTHHWLPGHRPNKCTAWVERTRDARVQALRDILTSGFRPNPPKVKRRYDAAAKKWRTISEPKQWPDQYVHHALVQAVQPVMMRGMDQNCCGSIRNRGIHYGKRKIERWVRRKRKRTKWCAVMDIRHFYDSISPALVMSTFRRILKDRKTLDLIARITAEGVKIGYYPSQWIANTALQALDRRVRAFGGVLYLRYMDNLTAFHGRKRTLHRLVKTVRKWLEAHGLTLKSDWQVFPTDKRLPSALGYRYGRSYTLVRKSNLLRLKRKLAIWRRRVSRGKSVSRKTANGLLSRLGQLRHCNNVRLYAMLFRGAKVQAALKETVRQSQRQLMTWGEYMAGYRSAPA